MVEQLLSPDSSLVDATPLFLASLLIKSGIVVGVAGVIAFLLRYSSASLRHMVLTIAVASLLVLPIASILIPAWELPVLPGPIQSPIPDEVVPFENTGVPAVETPAPPATELTTFSWSNNGDVSVSVTTPAPPQLAEVIERETPIAVEPAPAVRAAPAVLSPAFQWTWKSLLGILWLAGVAALLARLLLAHAGVNLLLRKSNTVNNDAWRFAVDRYSRLLEIDMPVRMRVSSLATVPMIIGCRRPMLVLPEGFESWTDDRRRIVLLHELAHVKRRDCLSQYLIEIVCALYWFNPMVWLASKQIRIEREIACDDMVLMAGTRPSTYAQTILDTIKNIRQEEWSPIASIAMARKSDIEGRLISILDPDVRRSRLNRASAVLTTGMIAVIAVPIALAVPVRKQAEATPEDTRFPDESVPAVADQPVWTSVTVTPAAEDQREFSFQFGFGNELLVSNNQATQNGQGTWDVSTDAPVAPLMDCCGPEGPAYEIALSSEAIANWSDSDTLTIRQLIRLRRYGVDSEFIDGLDALGYSSLDVDELIELAKYGADPEYISELNAAGYLKLDVDELVRFSKYGVDGDLINALRAVGYTSITADEIVDLSKYGLDEDDIEDFARAGFANVPVDELIGMSKYGVDPDDVAEFRAAGYTSMSTNDFIELSKYGVDPDDIAKLGDVGLTGLTVDELVDISKYGVDADDIGALASAGYVNLSVDDLVQISKYGVDVDDLGDLANLGYVNLNVDELIELSKYSVDVDEIAELNDLGYKNLSVDDLVNISKYGTDVDDLAELREMGYTNLTADDMIMIGRYGVDVDDVRALKAAGYVFTVDEMIELSRYGVDGDEIAQLSSVGYTNLSVDELVDLAKYGVDADDIVELADYGIKGLSTSEIIDLGKYGVDPEIVVELRKLGHDNVKPEYLIKMAKYGIDADYIAELNDAGVEASLDDIIELGKHNVDPDFVRKMKKGKN